MPIALLMDLKWEFMFDFGQLQTCTNIKVYFKSDKYEKRKKEEVEEGHQILILHCLVHFHIAAKKQN
jgi:hypothetical protein